jgi:hypothetical protein
MGMNFDIQTSDELGNTAPGYFFAEDNSFLKGFLATSSGPCAKIIKQLYWHLDDETLNPFGKVVLSAYVGKAKSFFILLMTLIRMGTLRACMATELCNLTFRKKHQVMRAFCFDIDMVFFVLNAISTITC